MVKIELKKQSSQLADFLVKIEERAKFRGKHSDPWENFKNGFYWDFHVGGFQRSISHELYKTVTTLLSKNKYLEEFLTVTDLYWILMLFLQNFFVGKVSGGERFFGKERFEKESKYNQSTLSQILEEKGLDKSHEAFLEKLLNIAYSRAKKKEVLWVFPMYFFHLITSIEDLKFMGVRFYHNNENGFKLLKESFPETTPELIELIKGLKEGPDTSHPAFVAVRNRGTSNRSFTRTAELVQQAFSFLKVVAHKNATPGYRSSDDNFFNKKIKEMDGIFHVIIQENAVAELRQASWIEVEHADADKQAFEEKDYHFVDNFFQHVYVPVRSSVSCAFIHPENLAIVKEDLEFFEKFFIKFTEKSIKRVLSNAASFFSEARREANPIKQVIMGTIALETVISSETSGVKGEGVAEVFMNRLTNLLVYSFKGNWIDISEFIGTKLKDELDLQNFIDTNIYKYRSGLVHGRNRKIAYFRNNIILKIGAYALYFTARLAMEKNISNSERLQKLMDNPL